MGAFRYLIVGGGMTADAACRGIRDHDADGSIGLVGEESVAPYARPPLSKALWKGKPEDSIWRGTAELGVELVLGRRIVSLDLDVHTATDDTGESHTYERLLLATGGTPRRVDAWDDGVVYYRTLETYRELQQAAGDGVRAAVVGGGFIGSEIAAALATNGCEVTIAFPDAGVGAKLFPAELAAFVNEYYRSQGVDVRPGRKVESVSREEKAFRVATDDGAFDADVVVAGLGIVPRTDLAEEAGLEVDDGVLVDEHGRAGGREDVFAAGDVARFPVPVLGGTRRVEHEDHANTHGRAVGANMAGADEPYDHLPFFYSDLFDLGYEAVGDVDSRLDTVAEWAEPNRKGVVCYVEEGKPRGFLLWDVLGPRRCRSRSHSGRPADQRRHASRPHRLSIARAASREPRDQGESQDVEDDVAARDTARRVPLREAEPRHGRLPRPGAERGAVELERCDHDEHACVDGPSRPGERRDEEGAAHGPDEVGRGEHRETGEPPRDGAERGRGDQHPRPLAGERDERHAREVDEAMARRDERRKVVEAIPVEPPHERADHLTGGRDHDDRERLQTDRARVEHEQRGEQDARHEPQHELTLLLDMGVEPERADGPRSDGREGDERRTGHRPHSRAGRYRFDR